MNNNQEKCIHNKIYLTSHLLSNPPQHLWICDKCKCTGSDREHQLSEIRGIPFTGYHSIDGTCPNNKPWKVPEFLILTSIKGEQS
jgi:hypothetical protein